MGLSNAIIVRDQSVEGSNLTTIFRASELTQLVMDGFGAITWWGFTPCLDLFSCNKSKYIGRKFTKLLYYRSRLSVT